ncbi:hypothetical protein [Motiliproteus sp. SC1-56]|uniref:hypothetical protein n=1 Tax=Motiliproteus sp. SC1-56 TaxID=2799565 RepID=UPI001A8E8156|nr:hypothetical protein [Motiliproteus sp. SC1-56]
MSNIAAIEKRLLGSAERLAGRENVKLTGEGLDALKPIIRGGCLKLDVMGMADDESRVDAAESNLGSFIRGVAKDVKERGAYKIDADDLNRGLSRGSIWPFS